MPKPSLSDLTTAQLRRIVQLREQIETLESELAGIIGGRSYKSKKGKRGRKGRRLSLGRVGMKMPRRKMTTAARAKMRAAAKARWAKVKANGKTPPGA